MDITEIRKKLATINKHIADKELHKAFLSLRELIANRLEWSFLHRIDEMENNYRYMIHYFLKGNKDPEQKNIYKKLISDLYILSDDAERDLFTHESLDFFYENIRIMQQDTQPALGELHEVIVRETDTNSFIDLLEEGAEKDRRIRENRTSYEKALQDLFYKILASPRADTGMSDELKKIIEDNRLTSDAKAFFVSALTMNLLHRFDARKVVILLDSCKDSDLKVATRAIVGIIPLIQVYSDRWILHPEIESRLKLLADDKQFTRRFMTAIIRYIQSHETEEITRQINDEILPEMIKLSPMIGKKIRLDEWLGESGIKDKNPEWEKLLDDTELTDKLQAFSNLQMEGADILHSTFSSLKTTLL